MSCRDKDVLPIVIKSRMSEPWIQVLNILSQGSIPSINAARNFLNGVQFKQDNSVSCKANSWEEFLAVLSSDDAVLVNGNFLLRPVFGGLACILQTRLLYLVHQNASKINNQQLSLFVTALEKNMNDGYTNHWVKDGIHKLRQHVSHSVTGNISGSDLPRSKCYEFSHASKKLLDDILNDKTLPDENAESKFLPGSGSVGQKVVDVIIINDDDDDVSPDTVHHHSDLDSTNLQTKTNDRSSDIFVQLDSFPPRNVNTEGSKSPPRKRRRKGEGEDHFSKQDECNRLVVALGKPHNRSDKTEGEPDMTSVTGNMDTQIIATQSSQALNKTCAVLTGIDVLTETLKENLQKLQEIFGDEKHVVFEATRLQFLLEMDPLQIESSCKYLQLCDKSEEKLVAFCDVLPWSEMGQASASALLAGCFYNKLLHVQSEASQIVQTALTSVIVGQPKVLIDMFIQIFQDAKSSTSITYQCNLLAALCKKAVSQEMLCYLIRQLGTHLPSASVNVSIVLIIQTALDRRIELDGETLTSLVTLLAHVSHDEDLACSPKLGKCLMACLTKYGKKISAENLVTISAIVDTHGSSFKAALTALLRRLNK